jgi:hypothetical protein
MAVCSVRIEAEFRFGSRRALARRFAAPPLVAGPLRIWFTIRLDSGNLRLAGLPLFEMPQAGFLGEWLGL